ncbi:MAG: hypothetical protein ACI8S6_001801 [Myxococcota bacterium]|jgi:hypothetical protein
MSKHPHDNWVLQSRVSTASPSVLTRTDWLAPLFPRMHSVLQGLYAAYPDTDRYTVAVFGALTEHELLIAYVNKAVDNGRYHDISDEKTCQTLLKTIKKDVGTRVPIELVALYGASRVETLREPGTRKADPQPTGCTWPGSATPHRVCS